MMLASISKHVTFIERVMTGQVADLEELHDAIAAWHDSSTDCSLPEWLGLTREEYILFVEQPRVLISLIKQHQDKKIMQNILQSLNKNIDLNQYTTILCETFHEFMENIRAHTRQGYQVLQCDDSKKLLLGYLCEATQQYWVCKVWVAVPSFMGKLVPANLIQLYSNLLSYREEGKGRSKMLAYLNNQL